MQFIQYNQRSFYQSPYYKRLPEEEREEFDLLSKVFHFKANNHVLENLIHWETVPDDPIYRLVFPRKEMLSEFDFKLLKVSVRKDWDTASQQQFIKSMRMNYFPNVRVDDACTPMYKEAPVEGAYRSTEDLLFLFPKPMVNTCHAFCTYCFRWISFAETELQKQSYSDPKTPIPYLQSHPEIRRVLFTGADPLVLKTPTLRKFIDPIREIESIDEVLINSKSLGWWPFRFTSDADAGSLIRYFEEIVQAGKKLILYAHFSHYREVEFPEVAQAVKRIRDAGVEIRTQGPIVKGINDSAEVWARMWQKQMELGMIPYHMFVEADHNPRSDFRLPLGHARTIFSEAKQSNQGLPDHLAGPVFMNDVIRVELLGSRIHNGTTYFELKCIQAPPGMKQLGEVRWIPYESDLTRTEDIFELFSTPSKVIF